MASARPFKVTKPLGFSLKKKYVPKKGYKKSYSSPVQSGIFMGEAPRLTRQPRSHSFAVQAVAALENNKTVTSRETKDGSVRSVVYDIATVKALKSMVAAKPHQFRLASTVIPYPTDAAGNMLATISFNPLTTSYPEWNALAALFDEVSFSMAVVTLVGGASSLKNIGIVLGYNPINVSSLPASTTAVTNLGTSRLISSYSTTPILATFRQKIVRRPYSDTATPGVQAPPAGLIGTLDFANAGASGTVSSTYFYAQAEIYIWLRNRI